MIPACFVFLDQEKASGPVVRVERDGFSPVFALAHAREIAWVPNRFEADEFAAAFVVAARTTPGTVRLLGSGLWGQLVPRDTRRVYVVQQYASLHIGVRCYRVEWLADDGVWDTVHLWDEGLKSIEKKFA